MSKIGKFFLVIAVLILANGFGSIFYTEIPTSNIESSSFISHQNGYAGMNGRFGIHRGYEGARTKLVLYKYSFNVEGEAHKGWWLKFGSDPALRKSARVYYNPWLPSISALERGISLFWVITLSLIGFGLIEIEKWLAQRIRHNKRL